MADSVRLGPGDYSGMKGYRYCRHQEHDPAVPRTAGAFLHTHSPSLPPLPSLPPGHPATSFSRSSGNRASIGARRATVTRIADPAVDLCGREARSCESDLRTRAAHCGFYCLRSLLARLADPA